MNIQIPDSWLREHLKTKATYKEIAKTLSLTSVSVERINKVGQDFIYDIEVTTNRADLMSVMGIAREAAISLKQGGIEAKFDSKTDKNPMTSITSFPIEIKNDSNLVNRICAVAMEVQIKKPPKIISERLEASGIRSLNNLIDITNYVMKEVGHPTHVFDLDRLNTKTLTIRRSQKGEVVQTLDLKNHNLLGDDIVAVDDGGRIVDLLGVMGTENSVVTDETKRILFFVDNVNPTKIRNTSMNLGIRTEAAVINEKGVDPELAITALVRGINLYQELANGKIISKILDIYPNKPEEKTVKVALQKINDVLGVDIFPSRSEEILRGLGFEVKIADDLLSAKVPSQRLNDIKIAEDLIEEIARIYGYHNLPSTLPTFFNNKPYKFDNTFYYEQRLKNALKYLGFTETYTYSMVSEELFEGPTENAIKLANPLSEDMIFMRSSLIPSLLAVVDQNKKTGTVKIFEVSNTYHKRQGDLPEEKLFFSGVVRKKSASFFEVKGVIEAVFEDLGISNLHFKEKEDGAGANIFKDKSLIGYIEVFDNETINFEFDFSKLLIYANNKKIFKPLAKFPPIIEDLSIEVSDEIKTQDIISNIKSHSELITEVSLLDQFGTKKTFHIIYQDPLKNLITSDVAKIRERIIKSLSENFKAEIK